MQRAHPPPLARRTLNLFLPALPATLNRKALIYRLTANARRRISTRRTRGELRRLAATQNNPLNSSASPAEGANSKTSSLMKSRVVERGTFIIFDLRFLIGSGQIL